MNQNDTNKKLSIEETLQEMIKLEETHGIPTAYIFIKTELSAFLRYNGHNSKPIQITHEKSPSDPLHNLSLKILGQLENKGKLSISDLMDLLNLKKNHYQTVFSECNLLVENQRLDKIKDPNDSRQYLFFKPKPTKYQLSH